jgi:GTPase SAR1 family protein
MGQAKSKEFKEAAERNKKLEQLNKVDNHEDEQKVKLLLLGAGESGKSTVYKQMKIIYGQSAFPEQERKQMTSVIHASVISNSR